MSNGSSVRQYHFKKEHRQSLIWLRLEVSSFAYRAHTLRLNYPSPPSCISRIWDTEGELEYINAETHLEKLFGQDILEAWSWRREEDSSETHDQERDTSITSTTNEEMGPPYS
jgi:hypothetical protein